MEHEFDGAKDALALRVHVAARVHVARSRVERSDECGADERGYRRRHGVTHLAVRVPFISVQEEGFGEAL